MRSLVTRWEEPIIEVPASGLQVDMIRIMASVLSDCVIHIIRDEYFNVISGSSREEIVI